MTVRFKVANLDFATGWRKDADQLTHLTGSPGLVVLLLQEAKNLLGAHTLASLLGKVWLGLTGQRQDTAGTAIYARGVKVRGLHQWLLGKFPQTLKRWATQGRIRFRSGILRTISAHIPPKRSGKAAQHRALDKLIRKAKAANRKGWGWLIGADWNMPLHEADAYFRAHGVPCEFYGQDNGDGIVGFLCSPNVKVSGNGGDSYGENHGDTDHPSWWLDVEGIKKG